jgi:hypothetical protein
MAEENLIFLPSQFAGREMTILASHVAAKVIDRVWPAGLVFDFSRLRFIRPAGVVFLHNLIGWLHAKSTKVFFRGHTANSESLRYLADSQFFRLHLGDHCKQQGTQRVTTCPLIDVKYEKSLGWTRLNLLPWVASRANVPMASLYGLQSSMAEIFTNIQNHSRFEIGSIFGQHFPSENSIVIAVSDMGLGIPTNVRKVENIPSDSDAIVAAVQKGFTSKSVETNSGMGLDQLLRSVVVELGGKVTIYSGAGMVAFTPKKGSIVTEQYRKIGFCPGTTIEINLDTRVIPNLPDSEDELQW